MFKFNQTKLSLLKFKKGENNCSSKFSKALKNRKVVVVIPILDGLPIWMFQCNVKYQKVLLTFSAFDNCS